MKKISWFRRLFMTWNNLKTLIINSLEKNQEKILNEKDKNIIELKTENINFKKRIEELKKNNEDLRGKDTTIIELKKDINQLKFKNETINNEKKDKDSLIQNLDKKIIELNTKINNVQNEKNQTLLGISQKLTPLNKIEKTFFGKSGNKGKANLAEKQLEEILISSNLPKTFWTKNLIIGNTQVEYAIKSGKKEKWIPIDSKIIEHENDEEDNIMINNKFKQKVITQVKNVAKYLNKSNTASYGVLVLQNDNLYMDLFKEYPSLFRDMIEKYKIYISSPSSFVQYCWSLSSIIEIYDKFSVQEKFYNEILSLAKTSTNFAISVKESYHLLGKAVNKHYPVLEKKQNKIQKSFLNSSNLKKITSLENKEKFKKEN